MFDEFLLKYGPLYTISVEERLNAFSINVEVGGSGAPAVFCDLWRAIQLLSTRDQFELRVSASELRAVTENSDDNYSNTLEFIQELMQYENEIKFAFEVRKVLKDDVLSIYSISHFDKYVASANKSSLLLALNEIFSGALRLDVIGSKAQRFGSKKIVFSGDAYAPIDPDVMGRRRKKTIFEESCNCENLSKVASNFLPSDFFLETETPYAGINAFFEFSCGVLSLAFIANNSKIEDDFTLTVKINGYKSIRQQRCGESIWSAYGKNIHKIYEWCYEGGSGADKIGLARNLVSIHCNDQGEMKFDNVLWEAINSNYAVYLKDNVRSYLEVKSKISEAMTATVEKTNFFAEELAGSMKGSIAVAITFLLTVVLVNGVKDNSVNAIFSAPYLLVVISISVICVGWFAFVRWDILSRYRKYQESIDEVLRTGYAAMLFPAEFEKATKPVSTNNSASLEARTGIYWKIILGFFAFFVLSFLVGYYCFGRNGAVAP